MEPGGALKMYRKKNMIKRTIQLLMMGLLSWLGPLNGLQAQEVAKDTTKGRVDVDHADVFEYVQKRGTVLQKLLGNVELHQDSVFMYCDTAVIEENIDVFATGNVIIQQGDSLSVFSDSLYYDGFERIADLYGDVILNSRAQELFTKRLTYNLNTKTATYFDGATLTDDSTQLTSRIGYYYVNTNEAYFKDSVVVVNPQFSLRSDTLKFNTETNIVTFLGPTLISSDSSRIYCEGGFYDTKNNLAEFTDNAQYIRGEQKARAKIIRYDGSKKEYVLEGNARFVEGARNAKADIIRYDELNDKTFLTGNAEFEDSKQKIKAEEIVYDAKKEIYSTRGRSFISDPPQLLAADQVDYQEETGMGLAIGNVVWQDTSANLTINCAQADYQRETGYLKAFGGLKGRPLLISLVDGDSLFMSADTLLSLREDTLANDSTRLLLAYYDVRVFKSDLQALSDSLAYSTRDSIFRFFKDPIVWSDTTQFTADTIDMQMANDNIDKIMLHSRSFIINSPDELFFNQIKGKDIVAHFTDGELRRMDVEGNAESVYYARDEKEAYVGVNETLCSDMVLFFGNNQVNKIKFITQPQATLHPMTQIDHNALRIKGFNWQFKLKPTSVDDLFGERAKRLIVPTVTRDLPPGDDTIKPTKPKVKNPETGVIPMPDEPEGKVDN
ncbi:MAG: hypothetical protein DHS20C18_30900 [Saprospiraceae bacterium]|nr:MAG: hypothetical protein DHS20C18_30900 [Saprospiraceae bacterium]